MYSTRDTAPAISKRSVLPSCVSSVSLKRQVLGRFLTVTGQPGPEHRRTKESSHSVWLINSPMTHTQNNNLQGRKDEDTLVDVKALFTSHLIYAFHQCSLWPGQTNNYFLLMNIVPEQPKILGKNNVAFFVVVFGGGCCFLALQMEGTFLCPWYWNSSSMIEQPGDCTWYCNYMTKHSGHIYLCTLAQPLN